MSQNGLPSLLERHWAESALAIGAILIAAVSLWVAYDTERTNRALVASEQQLVAANSWPFVQYAENDSAAAGGAGLSLMIMNSGIGPAKVETFEVLWHGQAQKNPMTLLQACCSGPGLSPDHPVNLQWLLSNLQVSGTAGMVLRPGENLPFLGLQQGSASQANWEALRSALLQGLEIRSCYCSAFNTCWVVDDVFQKQRDLSPPQVAVCPQPKISYSNAGL